MYVQLYEPSETDVLVIMDYPSVNDVKFGYIGQSHSIPFLRNHLVKQGIQSDRIAYYQMLDDNISFDELKACLETTIKGKREGIRVAGGYLKPQYEAPYKDLCAVVLRLKPKVIFCLSELALPCLVEASGLWSWRGSQLWSKDFQCNVLPSYPLFSLYRSQELQIAFGSDLYRLGRSLTEDWSNFQDNFDIQISPSFRQVENFFENLLEDLDSIYSPCWFSVDTETRSSKFISIFGVATSSTEAFVIPFINHDGNNYWTLEEELQIVKWIKLFLKHNNAKLIWQNGQYDAQYCASNWGVLPAIDLDTMVEAHMQFTKGLQLDLAYLASLYCWNYRYWKEDGKDFHKTFQTKEDFETYQRYNGYDCCYTYEIGMAQLEQTPNHVHPFVVAFQRHMQNVVIEPCLDGIRFNHKLQMQWYAQHVQLIRSYEAWFEYMIPDATVTANGKSSWWDSPTKLSHLLYNQFKLNVIRDKKSKMPTTGDAALEELIREEPILKILLETLREYRGVKKVFDSYLKALPTPSDGRMRTQYMIAGTDTFRLASKTDAFGQGLNFQNITKG